MEGGGGKRKMKGTYFVELPELHRPSKWMRVLSAINHWIWERQEEDMDLGGMKILARQRLNKYGIKLLAGKLRKIN